MLFLYHPYKDKLSLYKPLVMYICCSVILLVSLSMPLNATPITTSPASTITTPPSTADEKPVTAKPVDNTDIHILHVSHNSSHKKQPFAIQHPLIQQQQHNTAIMVAVATKNAKKTPLVFVSGKTMHPLNNAHKDTKVKSAHFALHWYYLLEHELPSAKGQYTISIQHHSQAAQAGVISVSNVSQTPPDVLTTNSLQKASTLQTRIKTTHQEMLVLDMVLAAKGIKDGRLVPDYLQKALWTIATTDKKYRKAQIMMSSRTLNSPQANQLTWRWQGESKKLNAAITSIIALKPATTPSSAVDAGEPKTLAVWQGPNLMPELARPAYLQPYIDPIYKTTITRITDESQSGYKNNKATLRHNYPNDQVWNADMSLIKLNFGQIRDANTYEYVREISKDPKNNKSYDQILWSNVDPDILYGLYKNTFNRYSLKTGEWTTLRTFEGYGNITTDYMASLSNDDRHIALHDEKWVIVYDLVDDKIIGKMPMGGHVTTASISQSGKYVLVTSKDGFFAYDQQLKQRRQLSPESDHDDFGYDADGNEVVIQVCPTRMIQIDNGKITDLLGLSYVCGHVSARNYQKPGWAYVSSELDTNDDHYGPHISTEIMEVKLDTSGIVNTLGHSRTTYHDYEANALIGVSPDGSKVIFHSDWGDKDGTVYSYVIDNKKIGVAQTTLQGKVDTTQFAANQPLHITWQLVSSDGGMVTFSNQHALHTQASFSQQGRYVLQLKVGDGQKTHIDNVVMTVGTM